MAKVHVVCELNQGVSFDLDNDTTVTIAGWIAQPLLEAKYKITELDESVWQEIVNKYGHMDLFKNGFIYVNSTKSKATDQANEKIKEPKPIDQLNQNGKEIKKMGISPDKRK